MRKREPAMQITYRVDRAQNLCQRKQNQSQETSANKFVISHWLEYPKELAAFKLKMIRQNENRTFSIFMLVPLH